MFDSRPFRALARLLILCLAIAMLAGCGGTAGGSPAGAPAATSAAPSTADLGGEASPDDATGEESPNGGTATDDAGGGTSAGDRTKGSAQAQVTGGQAATIDLAFAAPLALWASSGPGSAYLPFTDGDAVLFLTIKDGLLLVQYAKTSTGLGITSGASPCTLTIDVLDDSTGKGSFSCKGMTFIQGEAVGTADMSGTFDAHK